LRDPAPYSLEDIDRFSAVVDELGGDVETGLVGSDAVAAPSAMVPQPRRIVGLGDILSAVGFLARARHLQGRSPDGEADDR
jgi:ADP-dependent phosphofructokinase/glucokinase